MSEKEMVGIKEKEKRTQKVLIARFKETLNKEQKRVFEKIIGGE